MSNEDNLIPFPDRQDREKEIESNSSREEEGPSVVAFWTGLSALLLLVASLTFLGQHEATNELITKIVTKELPDGSRGIAHEKNKKKKDKKQNKKDNQILHWVNNSNRKLIRGRKPSSKEINSLSILEGKLHLPPNDFVAQLENVQQLVKEHLHLFPKHKVIQYLDSDSAESRFGFFDSKNQQIAVMKIKVDKLNRSKVLSLNVKKIVIDPKAL